jgi:N-acetylmuramoyl-L-alanine amidase
MSRPPDREPDSALAQPYRHSPNWGERKEGVGLEYIVLHYTGMDSGQEAYARLMDEVCEVSCHYLIWEDGRIQQLVAEDKRAWHAGQSFWRGQTDMNSASIGIELVHRGHDGPHVYPPEQIQATIALCQDICQRRSIPLKNIVAHSDIAPERKQDPGEFFPWRQLHDAGVGHWVEPVPLTDGFSYQSDDEDDHIIFAQGYLCIVGFNVLITGYFDPETEIALKAFQRHYRPERIDGILDVSTFETLKRLIAPPALTPEQIMELLMQDPDMKEKLAQLAKTLPQNI